MGAAAAAIGAPVPPPVFVGWAAAGGAPPELPEPVEAAEPPVEPPEPPADPEPTAAPAVEEPEVAGEADAEPEPDEEPAVEEEPEEEEPGEDPEEDDEDGLEPNVAAVEVAFAVEAADVLELAASEAAAAARPGAGGPIRWLAL